MKTPILIPLFLLAIPAFAQDQTAVNVKGDKAQALIGALQNVMPTPAKDAQGDYHYKLQKLECMGSDGFHDFDESPTYSFPSFRCTSPLVRGNSAATMIVNALGGLGFTPEHGMGQTYILIQNVDCVVHSKVVTFDDNFYNNRFECTLTGQQNQ